MIDETLARLRALTTVEQWEVWEADHFTRYRGVAGDKPVFVWTDARGVSARLGSPWMAPIYGPRGEEVPASPDPLLAVLRAAGIPPSRRGTLMTPRSPLNPEPPPQPAEGDVWAEIIAELPVDHILRPLAIERRAQGIERYGVPLQRDNGRDHLADALQEALDLLVYLRAANAPSIQGLARLVATYIARDVAARRSTP